MIFIKKYGLHYAWVILLASCILGAVSRADSASFGVFIDPLVKLFGWKRGDISFAYSLAFLAGLPAVVIMGWLGDRYGARKLMIGASLLMATGTVLMGTIKELWHFYVFYGLFVGSLGNAVFIVLLPVIVTRWFNRHMGMALGIYWAAMGLGPMIFSPLFSWLIETHGWEWTFFFIGVVVGSILITFSSLIWNSPYEKGLSAYGAEDFPKEPPAPAASGIVPAGLREVLTRRPVWLLMGIHHLGCVGHSHHPGPCSVHGDLPGSVWGRGCGCAQRDRRHLDYQPFRLLHSRGATWGADPSHDGVDWPEHPGSYLIICPRSLGILSVCRHLWPVLRKRDGRLPHY